MDALLQLLLSSYSAICHSYSRSYILLTTTLATNQPLINCINQSIFNSSDTEIYSSLTNLILQSSIRRWLRSYHCPFHIRSLSQFFARLQIFPRVYNADFAIGEEWLRYYDEWVAVERKGIPECPGHTILAPLPTIACRVHTTARSTIIVILQCMATYLSPPVTSLNTKVILIEENSSTLNHKK